MLKCWTGGEQPWASILCKFICLCHGVCVCVWYMEIEHGRNGKSTSYQSQWMWLIFFHSFFVSRIKMDILSDFVNACEISCKTDRTINNRNSWTNNFYYLISHPQMSYKTESHWALCVSAGSLSHIFYESFGQSFSS